MDISSQLGTELLFSLDGPQYVLPKNLGYLARNLPRVHSRFMLGVDSKDHERSTLERDEKRRTCTEALLAAGLHEAANSSSVPAEEVGSPYLVRAAELGNQLAMLVLGLQLMRTDARTARSWLTRGGVVRETDRTRLGVFLYLATYGRPPAVSDYLKRLAANCLLERSHHGDWEASAMLAYLVRRKEIDEAEYPLINTLLLGPVERHHGFASMNEILLSLKNGHDGQSQALERLGKLMGTQGVLEWWAARAREGDPEGHLVVALLVLEGISLDPDNLPITTRIEEAASLGLLPAQLVARQNL